MQNRRDFLKTAAFAAIGSGLSLQGVFAELYGSSVAAKQKRRDR